MTAPLNVLLFDDSPDDGRRAVEELRASEAQYRALFDCSPFPTWVFDRETLAFLAVNAAAMEHYGYSRAEFEAMTLADVDAPLEPDVGRAGRSRHVRKDGSVMVVETKTRDLEFAGRQARLVVCNDVTERLRAEDVLRKTEDQRRHAQKMEAVGRLAGGMAHDFNNVLSVILSYSELLLAGMPPGDALRADLEEIRNAGRRAADLTRQLLMFSRQQVVEARVVDVDEALGGMKRLLTRLLGDDVELLLLTRRPAGKVHIDLTQLEQVVMNLVVNARDAITGAGRVTIQTEALELDGSDPTLPPDLTPGPYARITVADTGSGMDASVAARAFEPYFTTKEKGKGTGLGLSTVFGIVKQRGGHVRVESEPGVGTSFEVYLPRAEGGGAPADGQNR